MGGKFEIAEDVAKAALKIPGAAEAASQAVKTAGHLLEDIMPRSIKSSIVDAEEKAQHFLSGMEPPNKPPHITGDASGAFPKPERPSISSYDASNYRYVPARNLISDIRTANGVSLQHVDGPARIVFDDKNAVQHVLVNRNASNLERDTQLLTASYAGLLHDDVLAREAAGKVMGRTAGFISQPIERFATQEEMQKNAVDGARAYFTGDAAGANNYTKFLTERFGPADLDTARHSMNSAVDGFTSPATESLLKVGIPITPASSAAASEASRFEGGVHAFRSAATATDNTSAYSGRSIPKGVDAAVDAASTIFGPSGAVRNPSKIARDILDVRSPEFRNLTKHE
jgi:hypothetical protein